MGCQPEQTRTRHTRPWAKQVTAPASVSSSVKGSESSMPCSWSLSVYTADAGLEFWAPKAVFSVCALVCLW